MAKCSICGKGVSFGIKVSHSHRRSNRVWKSNIHRRTMVLDGVTTSVDVCTKCLKSSRCADSIA